MTMNYKSTDINVLKDELHSGVVTFEYEKYDGSIRTAQGTLNDKYLPEKIPERVYLEAEVIDTLIKVKGIKNLEEYASGNGLEQIGLEKYEGKICYVFKPAKKKKKVNENIVTYYDMEKDAFRSFDKDRFLGML